MKKLNQTIRSVTTVILITFSTVAVSAQSTWDQVYGILTTNCSAASGCHGGTVPSFDLTDTPDNVYAALVNNFGVNPYTRDSLKYYIVEPGHPSRSTLFRKVAHSLDTFRRTDVVMVAAEGGDMPPPGRPELSKTEVELIRQWIIAGADKVSSYGTADSALIASFYNGNGRPIMQQPAPPPAGEGFQVHFGPIFFPANTESEYFMKDSLKLPGAEDIEVTALELFMNDESHHYILRSFKTPEDWDEGVELLNPITAFDSDKDYVMAWQNDEVFNLPTGSAYYWDGDIVLDHNFHMLNPYNEVIAGEVFLNVYSQPRGTAEREMKSSLVNNVAFFIPNNGQEVTYDASQSFSNISVWGLASHTHSNGKSFKIWLEGANGTPDSLIYDGMIDYNTGVNQGFYDYEHPPNRFWDCFLPDLNDTIDGGLKKYSGFKYEAKYVNSGPRNQTFGFTTEDEMMIFYVQYIDGEYSCVTGIKEPNELTTADLSVYPNPITDVSNLQFTLKDAGMVSINVVDMLGRNVGALIENQTLQAGEHTFEIDQQVVGQSGVYFVTLTVDGLSATTKVVITK